MPDILNEAVRHYVRIAQSSSARRNFPLDSRQQRLGENVLMADGSFGGERGQGCTQTGDLVVDNGMTDCRVSIVKLGGEALIAAREAGLEGESFIIVRDKVSRAVGKALMESGIGGRRR